MYKFKTENMNVPSLVWSEKDSIEEGALKQIENASSLPFAYKHTALMPDAHLGIGASIGSVIALENAIIPNLVGVDIGCGMMAVKTSLMAEDTSPDSLKKVMGKIRLDVPVGFNHHKSDQPFDEKYVLGEQYVTGYTPVVSSEWASARRQAGTLGGGNHFIEIQKDEMGTVWLMIHSGSRNLGKKVADHYNKKAVELNDKWHVSVPKEWQLAFLPTDSVDGLLYLAEMETCVRFAEENRKLMMSRVVENVMRVFPGTSVLETVNIAHNYAALENHYGKNVWVHRKGATRARKGEVGIIPGSQGSCSYIVEGLGNQESFMSCSHGAGRKMGRKEAQRTLNVAEQAKKLDDLGVIHSIRTETDLDEAPDAYKDIDVVMENQRDLVGIREKLTPLAVVKA